MTATPASIPRDYSLTERAALGIRELVLSGEFKPGQRVAELELAECLGVSRMPIRAALQRLEEEGLLALSQSTGYVVRGFTAADIDDAIEVRGTVEALAARMAAERGVPASMFDEMRACLAEIDAILAEKQVDADQLNRYADLNIRFHELLKNAAGSDIAKRSVERVVSLPFASPSAFVFVQSKFQDAVHLLKIAQVQHHDIVDAIEARAGTRVDALVKEHPRIARKHLNLSRHAGAMDQMAIASLIRRHNDSQKLA